MIEEFHAIPPYSLGKKEKEQLLLKEMNELTEFHRNRCQEYSNFLKVTGFEGTADRLEDIPFIPIRAFKELDLTSIPDDQIFKTMMSSGTNGQRQSKIYLDKETAILQQKVLLRLLSDFVGESKRLPMLVIDTPEITKDRRLFTTRGATIMGLDFMARKMIFALNRDMSLNINALNDFIIQYGGDKFIIFGFTFLVWQHLFNEIEKYGLNVDLSRGYLLTAGGWKKLASSAVSNDEFKKRGEQICGLKHYVDHYGMAEQTGCIYAECEYGHLHASIYSDIITRRYTDFSACNYGEKGFIQVLSSLPHSYPGHSILTEDEGIIIGEDDCPCGRKGKYIKVLGRVKNAEIRGCSDTYAAKF